MPVLSFGTIKLIGKFWEIRCEPHVRIRLKRVFRKVNTSQFAVIKLADSTETCRELLWFCQRFPMDIDPLGYMQEQSDRHEREEQMVLDVVNGHIPPPEFDLQIPLRDYQRVATDLALKTGGLLVGDDVGLGKTACSIGMFTDTRTLPALVVTLTHLPRQWQREIGRFAPKLRTHIIKQGTPYEISPIPDVFIINYHKLSGWADTLAKTVRSVTWDEVQELRRGDASHKGMAAIHIANSVGFRMGLSATPIYNHGSEMYNVMECIRPGALGDEAEFQREWTTWNGERIEDPKAFGTYLRNAGLMLRRTREDVQRGLPPLTKVPHWIDADFDAIDRIASSADELALAIVNKSALKQEDQFATEREFNALLRQATGIAKAPYVAEFVRILMDAGEQVVLYAWHREVYSLLMDRLRDYDPVMYTGTESPKQKDAAVKRFTEKDSRCLLISLRSGAGLDGLQHHCRTVVFGELDWSPGVHEQCIGRVHRDGQLDNVTAYYMLAKAGVDPFMSQVLGIKRSQIEGIKDPYGAVLAKYDVSGATIKQLAIDYLNQRRGQLTLSVEG